ncbi:hypothetical protein SynSYN20_01736 [Synechococcus sp. SYN20]|nr:hypothetical protein SynSYN20_01736 [Synechococcus sp. SYN20]
MYAWDLEEIESNNWTSPKGFSTNGLDQIDTVDDLMAYQMLAEHHQVVLEIRQYIQNNDNQWIIPRHKPST